MSPLEHATRLVVLFLLALVVFGGWALLIYAIAAKAPG